MTVNNFAKTIVFTPPSPQTTGTSIVVVDASVFPNPSVTGNFYAVISPYAEEPSLENAEIVLVTAIVMNTLTIVRQQQSTPAREVKAGDVIFQSLTNSSK